MTIALGRREAARCLRALLGAAIVGLAAAAQPAMLQAQTPAGPPPSLAVDAVILAEPAARTRLSIRAGPPEALPRNSFIRVRGLPAEATLSDGHVIAPGAWAVPLYALATLEIVVPAGHQGKSDLVVSLITSEGQLLAQARVSLVVAPAALIVPAEAAPPHAPEARAGMALGLVPSSPPAARPNGAVAIAHPTPPPPAAVPSPVAVPPRIAPPPPVAPVAPKLTAADRDRAARILARGDEQMGQGNVALARPFYRSAADIGLAGAALKLAQSYDPEELARLGVRGVQPDPAQARHWYARARELAAGEAEGRPRRLGERQ